jgi:hypothetical protein
LDVLYSAFSIGGREGGREGWREGGREGGWVGGRRIVIIMPEALYCVEGRRQKQS